MASRHEHLAESERLLTEGKYFYQEKIDSGVLITPADVAYVDSLTMMAKVHAEIFRELRE